jgi:hypothetical protein
MFEQVTLLLSFVYAIALTHILTSCTELIWARDRVRFSWLQALWMLSAVLSTVNNWLALFGLRDLKHWTIGETGVQFAGAIVQYFVCSLISVRPPEHGPVDMPAFFEKQRRAIFTAFAMLGPTVLLEDWWDGVPLFRIADRNTMTIDSINVALMALVLVGGWARPRWLQWIALTAVLALQFYFLANFAYTT